MKSLFVFVLALLLAEVLKAQTLNANSLQKWAESPRWLQLLHSDRHGVSRVESSSDGNGFFLAKEGKTSPTAELQATLQMMSSGEIQIRQKTQCRFQLRRKFLLQNQLLDKSLILACPERESWKKTLGATGVKIIFASSNLQSPTSSFGHLLLKFESRRGAELLDYGLSYAAQMPEDAGIKQYAQGLFGLIPGAFSFLPYHQKLMEYSNLESRDIWEYELNLNADETENLIDHIWELEGSFFWYYYLKENCAWRLLELLEIARADLHLTSNFADVVIPLEALREVHQANLVRKIDYRPSLQTQFEGNFRRLNLDEQKCFYAILDSRACEHTNVKILDTVLLYLDRGKKKDEEKQSHLRREVLLQRARLQQSSTSLNFQVPEPPHQSHRPSAFEFALGAKTNSVEEVSMSVYRHHWLDSIVGFVPGSQLELLKIQTMKDVDWHLANVNLLEMSAPGSFTMSDFEPTWYLQTGFMAPSLALTGKLGFGVSVWNLDRKLNLQWIPLVRVRQHEETPLQIGILFRGRFDLLKKLRLGLELTSIESKNLWIGQDQRALLSLTQEFCADILSTISYQRNVQKKSLSLDGEDQAQLELNFHF